MNDFKGLSYLIVDDVSSVREFLRQTLMTLEVSEIHEAANGEDAIEAFKAHLPDVVFLDIELPDMDGHLILKQLRQIKSNAFIVMVSAHSTINNVKEAISNGAAGFIVKPFSAKKITTVLKKYTG